MATDSSVDHEFSFTPSVSLFVQCDSEGELEDLFAGLSQGVNIMIPLDNNGFSSRYGRVNDRFGVSWQLNLE